MFLVAAILTLLLVAVLGWAAFVIGADLVSNAAKLRRLVKFGILDLLLLTLGLAAWLACYRLMLGSPLLGPTIVMATLLIPLLWLGKASWQESEHRRRRRLVRNAAPPPESFTPPPPSDPTQKRHRAFRLKSNLGACWAPRLSHYSLIERPLTLDDS